MDILRQGRHRARGGDPDRLRAWRRRAAARILRATGSRTGAALTFVVLAIVAWIAADVMVGEGARSPGRSQSPSANGGAVPPAPPNEPGLVAAAGPSAEIQTTPTPAAPPTEQAPEPSPPAPPPSSPTPSPAPTTAPPAPRPEPPPAPTEPAPANARTAYAKQYTLLVRSAPTQRADLVASLPNNTPVTLVCHTTGPSVVSFTGRTTQTWNKVVIPDGRTGYVSDGWVLTSADVTRLVPAC
ncbi:SH3 domain-containing protein [Streptodolium elevatio]|uniref:SH3 domain-containing protein n=1 Tax=Streptodolium elevatio TaxID=3157996 RepID=A0ABV3DU81_9ACTN